MKNPQSTQTLNTLGVAALLVSETFSLIDTTDIAKSYQGSALSEAMVQNLAQTVFEKELAKSL